MRATESQASRRRKGWEDIIRVCRMRQTSRLRRGWLPRESSQGLKEPLIQGVPVNPDISMFQV